MKLSPLIITCFLAMTAVPAAAQDRLPLTEAVRRALAQHPSIRASQAAIGEADARVSQARAGYLPRLDLVESIQRGDQPVFAFSSLLAARRFAESDFAIGSLNHPQAITNYRTGVAFEQPLFDGLRTRTAARTATLGMTLAETLHGQAREDIAVAVTQAYGRVLSGRSNREAAEAAVEAAQEDVKRAEHRRDQGLATEADVLALRVHLAQMQERRIRAASDETIARLEMNQAMGEPLDSAWVLDEVAPEPPGQRTIADLEREALSSRPEVRAAAVYEALAREARAGAKAAFLPTVSLQGFFELNGNGGAFSNRVSAWMVGAQARWTVFQGFADLGRLREAGHATTRSTAERERIEATVRVDVRTAAARVESAIARQQVGNAATAQARESQRIVRDRYEAGMASVNDVLRAANAVLDAESQRIGAVVDLLVSNAMLDRALGRISFQNNK